MIDVTAVVCDDHPIVRSGVVHCLTAFDQVKVVGEASNRQAAIAKLQLYQPDLLITDLALPDGSGFDLLDWKQENHPALRVFVLSMYSSVSFARRARDLGAAGYLAKEDTENELIQAIRAPAGTFYTSQSVGRVETPDLFDGVLFDTNEILKPVSPAEQRVLSELSRSKTNLEIADSLGISVRTVEAHRRALAKKLDAGGPNKLLEFAIRHRRYLTQNR